MSAGAPNFSPSLTLAGMDYIAPSAACIKPTLLNSTAAGGGAAGTVAAKRGGNHVLPAMSNGAGGAGGQNAHADVVKITLQDCLACSGCVTTAETVLVNAQSRSEIVSTLLGGSPTSLVEEAKATETSATAGPIASPRPRLVSISSQSCASLAAYLQLPMHETYALMAGFLRYALTPAALQEQAAAAEAAAAAAAATLSSSPSSAEATERQRVQEENEEASIATPAAASSPPSSHAAPLIYVISLEWAEQLSAALTAQEYSRRREEAPETLPMIVSACPGWVCYCEKQGSALLSHLCPVMSAQGIAGSYAKRVVAEDFYHISIQPCFDRKLEAARDAMPPPSDTEEPSIFYTDCVLSTAELLEWMKEVDPALPWRAAPDNHVHKSRACEDEGAASGIAKNEEEKGALPVSAAVQDAARLAGSGGYHQSVIADRLRRISASPSAPVAYEVKRNRNHQLATCAALPGEVFCVGYGFQQIQNVVRGLKKRMPAMRSYTFVELMACPDGCLNGGGQVRPAQQPHSEVLEAVINAYARHANAGVGGGSHAALDALVGVKEAEEKEEERATGAPRRRLEQPQGGEASPFADASIAAGALSLGDALWRCVFRDREKEFAEMLNAGSIHSLKW